MIASPEVAVRRPAAARAAAGSFNLVDSARAKVLLRDTVGDLQKAVKSIGDNTRKLAREVHALGLDDKKLNQILAGGTIEGTPTATLQQFKKAVRAAAIDGKIITINTRTSVMMEFKPDSYAELVFQTKQAEATNIATLESLQAKKMFYVKIIGSHSANFCTAYVGKVFYTGPGEDPLGLFPHVRTLPRGGPPFHPRCTKRFVAFIVKLATPAEIEAGKMSPDDQKRYLDTNSSQAQKQFEEASKPKAPPPPPVDRVAEVAKQASDARRTLREIDQGFKSTAERLDIEHAQLAQQYTATVNRGDDSLLADLNDQARKILADKAANVFARRNAGLDVLKVADPVRTDYVLDSALGERRKQASIDGIGDFAGMVDQAAISKLSIIVRPPNPVHKAGDRSYYYQGKVHLRTTADAGIVIHEIGHQLEERAPGAHEAAIAFRTRRTEGEQLRTLRSITGKNGYGEHERAWEDDFLDPYMGKDCGKYGSEIISTGLESFWRDPFQLATKDPEYFEFLFKLVRGVFK